MNIIENAVKSILRDLNVDVVRETSKGELNCRCPMPDHRDAKSSFSINKNTGLWNCFGCDRKGSLLFFYLQVKSIPLWKAIEEIRSKYSLDLTEEIAQIEFPEWENIHGYAREENKGLKDLYQIFKENRVPVYYKERFFDTEDWILWGGGVDHVRSLIVFPIYTKSSKIIGLVGRSTSPGKFRYMNYETSDPKSTLYGVHLSQGKKEVVVVEGLFDTQRTYGSLNEEVDVVGLLSTQVSDTQIELLRYWDTVSLWLDNDEEGRSAQERLSHRLQRSGKVVQTIPYLYSVKDQTDMDLSQIRDCFESRQSFLIQELDRMLLT